MEVLNFTRCSRVSKKLRGSRRKCRIYRGRNNRICIQLPLLPDTSLRWPHTCRTGTPSKSSPLPFATSYRPTSKRPSTPFFSSQAGLKQSFLRVIHHVFSSTSFSSSFKTTTYFSLSSSPPCQSNLRPPSLGVSFTRDSVLSFSSASCVGFSS